MLACAALPKSVLPFVALLLLAGPLCAQQGDRAGESQTLLPDTVEVPPAPVLSPAEAQATFRLADGFAMQLVAAEPLIQDPVAATFDLAGQLWVVEMRAYMRTVDAAGERDPIGRISVLRDTDGDGRMDQSVV